MIEIDGTAYPFEPGKSYLLVVDSLTVSAETLSSLAQRAWSQHSVKLLIIPVRGPVQDAVRLLGPLASEGLPGGPA